MTLTPPDRAALRDLITRPRRAADLKRSLGVETATRRWLAGGVMPLWLGAGLADWYRHKQTRIEDTAGARESMIHGLMMTEAGIPVTLGLFCEVNPGVLAICAGALAAHGLTAYWDVSYAEERRPVTPVEQHIHSVLEMAPVMATGFLAALYWDQARALVGFGGGRPDFALRGKRRDPLTGRSKLLLLGAMGLFGVLPYAEEMLRCLRRRPTIKAQPVREEQDGARSAPFRADDGTDSMSAERTGLPPGLPAFLLPAVPDPVEFAVEIGVMPRQCLPLGLPGATAPLPQADAKPDGAPDH